VSRFIEDLHEVKLKRRLADIRPWTVKAAEMIGDRFIFTLWVLPLLVVSLLFPLLALVMLPTAAVIIVVHRRIRPLLPMRYPMMSEQPDPQTGKQGAGILFFGNQESSSPYENFKEIWASDDDLRKHMLILGSTGSGKSETLKSLFFNALCWSSGFFIADGKADNKLPTDVFTMVRSVGMDDNLLTLNFLLAGKTPEQVRRSRRRRTNKLNPFTSADADTIIQMGANMLPKVEGDGKNWQEKALNLWRAMVVALCYKRDTQGFELSVSTLVEYMNLAKIEELYIEGYDEAKKQGEWSYGFISIKTYLDSGCPAYKVDKLLAKFNREVTATAAPAAFGAPRGGKAASTDQDSMAYEQHAYRTSQLMPVLNLLDKTYGHIFRDKYPEIDMVDVTLNNRIMTMLIPSLEKSAQEAENLGKLAIACLRVMMSRNLGGGVEGTRMELLESKATNSPYPYLVALDELGYYFSDGIAVIFAQARSLGFCMIPAAQDLEKLTEGSRAAEAGAMMANAVTKIFLRIDDAKKTYEFVQGIVGKAMVPIYRNFEFGGMGWRRKTEVDLQEVERVSMKDLQAMEAGQGLINGLGKTTRFRSYYMDSDLKKHRADNFYVLRFLQVPAPTDEQVRAYSLPYEADSDPHVLGERLRSHLSLELPLAKVSVPPNAVIDAVSSAAAQLSEHTSAEVRAIALFEAARLAVKGKRTQERRDVEAEAMRLGTDIAPVGIAARPALQPRPAEDVASEDPPPMSQDLLPEGLPDGLDLEALLSPHLPFERRAVEELRAVDAQPDEDSARLAQPQAADPVESFLSGIRFFNMPQIQELAAENASVPSLPPADLAASEEHWLANAVASSVQKQPHVLPDRTAMGFVPATTQQLCDIEELLGNPKPVQAVRNLQAVVSEQITPRVSAELPKEDWEIDQLLKDLDGIDGSLTR
jgi:intracellular multiplication protein IcmO